MKPDETHNQNRRDEVPKVGENFEVWYAGHIPAECVSHQDEGTLLVRLPWGEERDAEWDGTVWVVSD